MRRLKGDIRTKNYQNRFILKEIMPVKRPLSKSNFTSLLLLSGFLPRLFTNIKEYSLRLYS
jgi:hypothetical protein